VPRSWRYAGPLALSLARCSMHYTPAYDFALKGWGGGGGGGGGSGDQDSFVSVFARRAEDGEKASDIWQKPGPCPPCLCSWDPARPRRRPRIAIIEKCRTLAQILQEHPSDLRQRLNPGSSRRLIMSSPKAPQRQRSVQSRLQSRSGLYREKSRRGHAGWARTYPAHRSRCKHQSSQVQNPISTRPPFI